MTAYTHHHMLHTKVPTLENTRSKIRHVVDAQKHHWTNWWEEVCGEMMPNWRPTADIYEDGNKLVIEMDIPGVDPDTIDIDVDPYVVKVHGKKITVRDESDDHYHKWERDAGCFVRTVRLPYPVIPESIQVTDKLGVLHISLSKKH